MERTALCFYNSGEPERLPGLLQSISAFESRVNQFSAALSLLDSQPAAGPDRREGLSSRNFLRETRRSQKLAGQ